MDDDRSSISVPEEIVAEILVRLHIGPLFRFKLVSKQWNSIISDPEFGQNYLQRLRSSPKPSSSGHLCALLKTYISGDLSSSVYNQDPPPSLHISTFFRSRCKVNEETVILGSSSGLILSLHCLPSKAWKMSCDFSVSNPLAKQSVLLPPLNVKLEAFDTRAFGFATRNNPTYLTYKVVVILREWLARDHTSALIMVFSSDKGSWTCNKPILGCPEVPFFELDKAFSCKGVLHWVHLKSRSIVTYDPYDSPDRFGHIQFPIGSDNVLSSPFLRLIQFGYEDMLKYIDIESVNGVERVLRVWNYDKGEWCLKHKCPISQGLSDSFLFDIRWVGPGRSNDTFFAYFWDEAIDLRHAAAYMKETAPFNGGHNRVIPIALCPWSSPFYGEVRCNPSSIVGFRKISTVWVTSC